MDTKRPLLLAALAPICGVAACVAPADNRADVGGWVPEALSERPSARAPVPPIDPQRPDGPSITTLDRGGWADRPFVVGNATVRHYPTYTTNLHYTREHARQRGEFPTPDTVLETTSPSNTGTQALEGLAAPFWAVSDLALLPIRAAMQPPWRLIETAPATGQRAPQVVPPAPTPAQSAPTTPAPGGQP